MKKVTFKSIAKIGKKIKEYTIVEYTEASEDAIKLRAMALNWQLVSIELGKV